LARSCEDAARSRRRHRWGEGFGDRLGDRRGDADSASGERVRLCSPAAGNRLAVAAAGVRGGLILIARRSSSSSVRVRPIGAGEAREASAAPIADGRLRPICDPCGRDVRRVVEPSISPTGKLVEGCGCRHASTERQSEPLALPCLALRGSYAAFVALPCSRATAGELAMANGICSGRSVHDGRRISVPAPKRGQGGYATDSDWCACKRLYL
jgi:hypothetical protein